MFVQGISRLDPFNRWHFVKRSELFGINHEHKAYTTSCDLYMMSVRTAESFEEIPLLDELCTTEACAMRRKFSDALQKCASENRQSEWTVRY